MGKGRDRPAERRGEEERNRENTTFIHLKHNERRKKRIDGPRPKYT
jgi:hypothetical protein